MKCITSLVLVSMVTVVMSAQLYPPRISFGYFPRVYQRCRTRRCELIRRRIIMTVYGGLFFTKAQLKLKDVAWREQHEKYKVNSSAKAGMGSDYDQCCPTHISHTNATHMINTKNQPKSVVFVDLPGNPLYQHIPAGSCGTAVDCNGTCRMEQTVLYLLVWKLGHFVLWPFEFDAFYVPIYCSCKSS